MFFNFYFKVGSFLTSSPFTIFKKYSLYWVMDEGIPRIKFTLGDCLIRALILVMLLFLVFDFHMEKSINHYRAAPENMAWKLLKVYYNAFSN
jgi:hypothetical protein